MTQRVYVVEREGYGERHRMLLVAECDLNAEEWAGVLGTAYSNVRTMQDGDPEQLVVAAAAWLVAHGNFSYADEVRG